MTFISIFHLRERRGLQSIWHRGPQVVKTTTGGESDQHRGLDILLNNFYK